MIRAFIAIIVGTAVTFSLLWVMQYLIATGAQAITDDRTHRFVDFVRVQRQEETRTREERPERPPEPDRPPPDTPDRDMDDIDGGEGAGFGVGAPEIDRGFDIGGRDGFFSDGEYMPIVQVAPQYPRRAQQRGLEGWVTLEFVVTRQGTVRDPVVIESSSSIFERAALEAVQRFRYRPRVIDGEPVDVPGVQFRITFELED